MKYNEFRQQVSAYPIFKSNMLSMLSENTLLLRRQVSEWAAKGNLCQLKRGVYVLNDQDRRVEFSSYFLSAELCKPSYVSLESALSFYHLIPERVESTTAITTKKTQSYENAFGCFVYHHIATHLFDFFRLEKDEFGLPYYMATPEKALVDYFYFQSRLLKTINISVFENNFRLQNLSILNREKIILISNQYNKKKLHRMIKLFLQYMESNYD